MALVVIKQPQLFPENGLRFDVTVEKWSISILHNGPIWGGWGDVPFSLISDEKEVTSLEMNGKQHCLLPLDEDIGHIILKVGGDRIFLEDI